MYIESNLVKKKDLRSKVSASKKRSVVQREIVGEFSTPNVAFVTGTIQGNPYPTASFKYRGITSVNELVAKLRGEYPDVLTNNLSVRVFVNGVALSAQALANPIERGVTYEIQADRYRKKNFKLKEEEIIGDTPLQVPDRKVWGKEGYKAGRY